MPSVERNSLLELAPPELVVPLKVRYAGRAYRVAHRLRPPAPADWFAYEAALQLAVEELPPAPGGEEPRYRLLVRSAEAALELWDRLARGAEGYAFPGSTTNASAAQRASAGTSDLPAKDWQAGTPVAHPAPPSRDVVTESTPMIGAPLASPEADWRGLIPLAHKEAAIRALTLVAPAALDALALPQHQFPLHVEQVPVLLEAVRAGRAYPRLLHFLRPPTVADERNYRRLLAETLMVRGSRHPRTLIPARLPALCRLYDSLILSVEGYCASHQPLTSREEAARHMDAWHKRVAVQALFGDVDDALPGSSSEESLAGEIIE